MDLRSNARTYQHTHTVIQWSTPGTPKKNCRPLSEHSQQPWRTTDMATKAFTSQHCPDPKHLTFNWFQLCWVCVCVGTPFQYPLSLTAKMLIVFSSPGFWYFWPWHCLTCNGPVCCWFTCFCLTTICIMVWIFLPRVLPSCDLLSAITSSLLPTTEAVVANCSLPTVK